MRLVAVLALAVALAGTSCAERLSPPTLSKVPAQPTARHVGPLVALGWVGDRVAPGDKRLGPDGRADYVFRVRVSGEVEGLILSTSDLHGTPGGPDAWDTFVAPTMHPKAWRIPHGGDASLLWGLAVYGESDELLNPEMTLHHTFHDEWITIFAPDPGASAFVRGRTLTLLVVRPGGALDRTTTTLL